MKTNKPEKPPKSKPPRTVKAADRPHLPRKGK